MSGAVGYSGFDHNNWMIHMNWDAIGAVGELVGSAAVLVTLIYLALQIRQNTHATRAASHHAITDALNQLNLGIANNDAVAQIWLTGMSDRSSLNDLQRERYDALLRAYMHVCDTMYYQAQVGAGDHGLWEAEERYIGVILTSNGGKGWLEENYSSISPGFRAAVDNIIQHKTPSGTDPLAINYATERRSG